MNTPAPLLSAADIATMAGVGRSTVSNWRKRHQDFPTPVEDDSNGVRFKAAEVKAWLASHDKATVALSTVDALFRVLDAWRPTVPVEEAVLLIGDLMTWRFVSDPASTGFDSQIDPDLQWPNLLENSHASDRLADAMAGYEQRHGDRGPLFETPQVRPELLTYSVALESTLRVLDAFDVSRLSEEYDAARARMIRTLYRGADIATSDRLIELFAALTAQLPGSLHDPVAGSGRLLAALATSGVNRPAVTGQDINRSAVIQANQRLLLAGAPGHVQQGDVLEDDKFPRAQADVVVMEPPYALRFSGEHPLELDQRFAYGVPRRMSMDMAWPQIALWHLAPGGRAFVLQPVGSASRSGADQKIRSGLLQAGVVEAVIALPGGLASHTQIPLNLWIMKTPEPQGPQHVLMIDASNSSQIEPAVLAFALEVWRARGEVEDAVPAVAVATAQLLAEDANLDPRRWVISAENDLDALGVKTAFKGVESAVSTIKPPQRATPASVEDADRPLRMISLADLERAGHLEIKRATAVLREKDLGDTGNLAITGAWIRGHADDRRIDRDAFPGPWETTEPGDVLLQNTGGLAARVDRDGGRVLCSPSFLLLRLATDSLSSAYLAAAIPSTQNRSRAQGSGVQRVRIQDITVPLIAREEQAALVAVLDELDSLRQHARALEQAASDARDAVINGLTAATIRLT